MKKLLLSFVIACLLGGALAFSKPAQQASILEIQLEPRNPWTSTQLSNNANEFQFAIVSDRTGGHRAKIFSQAVDRLNLLQPEFVLSVGDLIEGGNKSPEQLKREWDELDTYVRRLEMPFFYVPGNHDVGNDATEKFWAERFGRRYYHFVYRNVLFLCLNTDDKPGPAPYLSEKQVAYALDALKSNAGVRWTIVSLHKPIWTAADQEKSGWQAVEKALASRPYTVFCGHVHRFQKFVRQGRNYYQLATTGGGSKMRGIEYGEFDEVVWVTMKPDGPQMAHLLVDSILPADLQTPQSEELGQSKAPPQRTYSVRGRLHFEGVPAAGAYIVFQLVDDRKRRSARADAIVEADGTFRLSTYSAFDGAPEGDYVATVVWRKPFQAINGKEGPNLLPAKYANVGTSGLRFTIKPAENEISIDLSR